MKINEIKEILNAEIITDFSNENTDIKYGFASDLMSDALALVKSESLLITGLNNSQVIRTAEMLDMSTVLFVRGKRPCQDAIKLALENRISILSTDYTMFKTCSLLAINGMEGIEADD
ncbi:DRTGG domain-containing protein [Sedimentibacter sp.]|uniref:DRTGG domain-containing protein n=1 Tax=Sedimentibacter sp. TaxID=1960295 RepID=UPI0028B0D069|nr:DRTGG domain-containing protein [Sedimentibacter sp.]